MNETQEFLLKFKEAIANESFIKITLSKVRIKESELTNVYIRPILLKNNLQLSFTYRYKTNDQTKNYSIEESIIEIPKLLESSFHIATLFTIEKDTILKYSKQNKTTLFHQKASIEKKEPLAHNRPKINRSSNSHFLTLLGIKDSNGEVIPKMADKFRQITKYLEIIESLLNATTLPEQINVVDMGSGKGYLTFALYDYLKNTRHKNIHITGIELRPELVDVCNNIAQECGFENLNFICQSIQAYNPNKIDILIALHACDTATDDALYKGIRSNAQLIICAPCCHKQIRKQVKGLTQESPLLQHGIFQERHFEMVTDTIRGLILEEHHYQSKIFEFISNEHTRKNIMLVGTKHAQSVTDQTINKKITDLKSTYHISEHYLETLLKN